MGMKSRYHYSGGSDSILYRLLELGCIVGQQCFSVLLMSLRHLLAKLQTAPRKSSYGATLEDLMF